MAYNRSDSGDDHHLYVAAQTPGDGPSGTALMVFWGLTLMVFVDHVIGWFLDGAEGDFFDIGVNEFILSICMIVPILVIWEGALIADRFRLRQAMAAKTDDRLREKKEMI